MADIEVVIKIDEEVYNDIKEGYYDKNLRKMAIAIGNGAPLPKGHGRLIDVNSIYQIVRPIESSDSKWGMTAETAKQLIYDAFDNAPTIIEADEENKK